MRLPVTDINQSGDMISGTVWCTFQWTKPEHGRAERLNKTKQNEGRNCLGGPLRSCSQDSLNNRTKETGSGRTMTLSSQNKANYSNVRARGHRRWALITRQTALSCPIKWNAWHLTMQQIIASVWRNKYAFVGRIPLSRKSRCHHSHCESRLRMFGSLYDIVNKPLLFCHSNATKYVFIPPALSVFVIFSLTDVFDVIFSLCFSCCFMWSHI